MDIACFIIFPGHQKAIIPELRKVCAEKGLLLKIWDKRMIENYLPDSVIREWMEENRFPTDHIYFTMTPEQKKCFHLKRGIRCKDARKAQVKALYQNLLKGIELDNLDETSVVIPQISDKLSSKFVGISQRCCVADFGDDIKELTEVVDWIKWYI